jgi:hypothetical protein
MVVAIARMSGTAAADEVWVSPTYQQDLGGLGIGSNVIWPASAAGAVRLAWAIPNDLQTFQSAKVVLIPHSPGGAATLNILICPAQNGNLVASACAGPFAQPFTGVVNQLTEIDVSGIVSPRVGAPGANYLAVLAYTSPTTATDHIVGLRFAYASTAASLGSSNVFTAAQTVNVAAGAAAVVGHNVAGSHGVEGISDSGDAGVFGKSNATSGASYGVYGDASANLGSGTGVFGIGTSYGLFGQSTRTSSTGVFGRSAGVSGQTYGVYGEALATTPGSGFGVFGTGNGFGVYGNNESTGAGAAGVWGESRMSSGAVYGVGGLVNSTTVGAAAVFGNANGASGTTFGVRGVNASNSTDAAGVRGDANGASGTTAGGYFRSASSNGTGVLGWAPSGTGATYGVRGESDSNAGTGIFGWAPATNVSTHTFGVKGQSEAINSGIGVVGIATDGGKSVATMPLNDPVGVLGVVPDASPNGFGVVSIGNAKVFGGLQADYTSADDVYASHVWLIPSTFPNSLPQCVGHGSDGEGMLVSTYGGAGTDGHLYMCRQKADNSWEWKQIF